jgi:tRNA1(Val) A37 N6-methylase TrmN6
MTPSYIVGDSNIVLDTITDKFDFVYSCPPYYDLEQYSDDPNDLSNIDSYDEFLRSYRSIIAKSCALLKDDRFACFVVGDIRDKNGFYRNFVSDTTKAFI